MAIGWFIAKYKRRVGAPRPTRYCSMDDYTPQIFGEGGNWAESEVLGDHAVVKVRASDETLSTIASDPNIVRVPLSRLDDPMSRLGPAVRNAIRNKVLSLGYTSAEIEEHLGVDISAVTLGQLLRFITRRRLKPRYDPGTDTIICDGPEQPVRPVESIDSVVR